MAETTLQSNTILSPPESRAVLIAPYHADWDLRVRRTIPVLASMYRHVDVFWDSQYIGHRRPENRATNVYEHYVERRRGRALLSLAGFRSLETPVTDAVRSANLVYIHSSGIEGVLFSREARRVNSICRIVFDYHDSLSYELFYQLAKLKLGWLFGFAWTLYRPMLRRFARNVDGVVGISANQLSEFQAITAREFRSAVVPNLRAFSNSLYAPGAGSAEDKLSLVWLGQVMRGRDLERLATLIAGMGTDVRFHVFGEVLDQDAKDTVKNQLRERAIFYGKYKGDADIAARLPPRSIGVFLGWDDPCETGINRIASPNKYFSYVNLLLPVILDRQLEGLAAEVHQWRAGLSVGTPDEFIAATRTIQNDYPAFCDGMRQLKNSYSNFSPEQTILSLLESVNSRLKVSNRLVR